MKINYTMYLDDLRTPIEAFDIVVRSYQEATEYIIKNGVPKFISFDHDLGINEKEELLPSGYDLAKWLVNADAECIITLPCNFTYKVHSQNPVGKKNIEALLESYLRFKAKK